jgi:DNA polymerase IV
MSNSTGIAEMLKKRTRKESSKRKASLISLVPEHERIFQGQTFYYIPPDDVAPLRRMRITKAGSYGATWANEWIASITHVVVDKALTYEDVMIFIKNNLKVITSADFLEAYNPNPYHS